MNSQVRDFVGYGRSVPTVKWPGGARLAVQIVVNYEEGGEHSVLDGDPLSEAFVTEEPSVAVPRRNLNVESQYEYGSRAGFWRLWRLLTKYSAPVTVFGVTLALSRNRDAVAAMKESGWEIASHGFRWIDYSSLDEQQEASLLEQAVTLHAEVTGSPPLGWYTGRWSERTRTLLNKYPDFLYDSDSFADDLPFFVDAAGSRRLVIPYTLDNNDVRFVTPYGFNSPDFCSYLSGAADLLLEEGRDAPKLMNVGLHCRLSGRPGRAYQLEQFLDKVTSHPDIWVCTRADVARHWLGQASADVLDPVELRNEG